MRSLMRNSFPPAIGLLALVFMSRAPPKQVAPKPEPPKQEAPKQDDPKQEHPKADATTLEQLEERVRVLEKVVQQQEADLEHLFKISDALATAALSLAGAADKSRELGFEFAGPNPAARTELLNGLKGFSEVVRTAVHPPPPPDQDKNKK